jgi:hypothetical protein
VLAQTEQETRLPFKMPAILELLGPKPSCYTKPNGSVVDHCTQLPQTKIDHAVQVNGK